MPNDDGPVIYLMHDALDRGVRQAVAECVTDQGTAFVKVRGFTTPYYRNGLDWTHDRDEALRVADAMRVKEIMRLRRRIKKLTSMTFEEIKKERQ